MHWTQKLKPHDKNSRWFLVLMISLFTIVKHHLRSSEVFIKHKLVFFNQTFNDKAITANFTDNSNFKIGKKPCRKLIPHSQQQNHYQMLNSSFESFKITCKVMIIKNQLWLVLRCINPNNKRLLEYKARL